MTRQAQTIAYIDDFKLMMIMAIVAMPLLFLIREPIVAHRDKDAHAALMD